LAWGADEFNDSNVTSLQSSRSWQYNGTSVASVGDGSFYAGGTFNAPLNGTGALPGGLSQSLAKWTMTGWTWMVQWSGTTPASYMERVDAMTVRSTGQLIVAGLRHVHNTNAIEGIHTFDGTTWTTMMAFGGPTVLTMCCVTGYPDGEHLHYGGWLRSSAVPNVLVTHEWSFASGTYQEHPFNPEEDLAAFVPSIVQFESTNPVAKVWCTRSRECEPGTQGPGNPDLPDACWLNSEGVWQAEDVNLEFVTNRAYAGHLAVDYSMFTGSPPVRTPTLVLGYEDVCARNPNVDHPIPWLFYDCPLYCGTSQAPPQGVLRRWPDSTTWVPAANPLRGNVRAIGCVRVEPEVFRLFVAGDSFMFDPETYGPHDYQPYHQAGVFSCGDANQDGNPDGWEHGRGILRDKLGPNFPNLPEPDNGTVYAFCRNGSPCFYSEEAIFGGVFRGVRWAARPTTDPFLPYERRAAQIAVYGQHRNDFDQDGSADFFDYDAYFLCFQDPTCTDADFNCDGTVDFFDYDDWVTWFEFDDNE
jgi:hypothetical protein